MPQLVQPRPERGIDRLTRTLGTPTAAVTIVAEPLDEQDFVNTDPTRLRKYLEYVRLRSRFDQLEQKLKDMAKLLPNWNSYGAEPPVGEARARAAEVLILLQRLSFPPTNIVPSSEGGVSIYFLRGDRYADIEFLNNGEMLAVTYVGTSEPDVWPFEPGNVEATVDRVVAHFSA